MTLDARHDELIELLHQLREDCLPAAGEQRLAELLEDESLRRVYVQRMGLIADLRWQAIEGEEEPSVSGWPLAPGGGSEKSEVRRQKAEAPGAPPTRSYPRSTFRNPRFLALAVAVSFVAIGVLAYVLWPNAVAPPVVQPTPVVDPAAKLVGTTDAQWQAANGPSGDALKPGERLVLTRGSAEIAFNNKARVIVEAPTELTIVDAAACRLSTGKLTAHVPDPAKGFKVHTPDGTVTDLGTEFGVYVKTGPEILEPDVPMEQQETGIQQDGQQPPVTEVHVFKGKVDVVQGDQLAQTPLQTTTSPPSAIAPRTSTVLSAGQAVTISQQKVQPLPAADPFKFALDKLQGNPRQVLLSEDFEALTPGSVSVGKGESPGGWTAIGATRKGQGGFVIDPVERQEGYARAGDGRPAPVDHAGKTPFGRRAARVAFTCQPPHAPVWLGHEIDGRALSGRCQILIEFDILRDSESFHPVLAFGPTLESRVEIPFTKNANAAAAATSWVGGQWYRQRLLLNVVDGKLREARVQRMKWEGKEGWKPDEAYSVRTAQAEWPTTPRYIAFGSPPDNATFQWLDNIRLEVITEK